ncbi:MAG TPA: glycosyltransferase family 4 protein [Bryobacteraceae bacterium]|jgi:glycosyltransferase involved in cell wall biosynthesis|nr:glycosyltransferase family 4 protein [Bryobacteraceae bacterium]
MATTGTSPHQKVVVVHRGARDAYQAAAALAQAGLLERLVTDLYWANDPGWQTKLFAALPSSLRALLLQRHHPQIPGKLVSQTPLSGLTSYLLEKRKSLPFSIRRSAIRRTDATLGRTAGTLAARTGSLLLSYSYYGYQAFSSYGRAGILFQLHPHPASVRRILEHELAAHPDCAESLRKEWELSLPPADFDRLVAETKMADRFLVASSFTRKTLIEHGAAPDSIRVVPYGVDLSRFSPGQSSGPHAGPLRLLFVGTINQRKGIKYLLEALRLLGDAPVELTVCGRVVDSLALFAPFGDRVKIRPSVSLAELQSAYRKADLFVFPSVAEGFAQVLLESLASGLPILSTTHTAAPDLIEHGREGFVVAPRRPDLVASYIEWALAHRTEVHDMRAAARKRAEFFTWERFQAGVVAAVREFAATPPAELPPNTVTATKPRTGQYV